MRRQKSVYANLTDSAFGTSIQGSAQSLPFESVLGQKKYVVPIYFSGGTSPVTQRQSIRASGNIRRLSEEAADSEESLQGEHVRFTAADFADLYAGQSSLRRKYQTLVKQKFLDWQLSSLEVTWMAYNGDSDIFTLNSVSAKRALLLLQVCPAVAVAMGNRVESR